MAAGRQTYVPNKEKISFSIAHIEKGGERFEIVLKNPDLALEFRQGKEMDPKDFLEAVKQLVIRSINLS